MKGETTPKKEVKIMKITTTYTVEFTKANGFITETKEFDNALDIPFFTNYYRNKKDTYKRYTVRSYTTVTLFGIALKKDTNLLEMWSDGTEE
jgi:hypothetical protein